MTAPMPPEQRSVEQRERKAPSETQAWTMVTVIVLGFIVGGLGLIFHGWFWLLYAGIGVVVLGFLYGWWIDIFEMTEEETRTYRTGETERVEPATESHHG